MNPILGIILWFVIVIGSSYLFASVGWMLANDLCALNKPYREASIEIPAEWINVTKEIENEDGTITNLGEKFGNKNNESIH